MLEVTVLGRTAFLKRASYQSIRRNKIVDLFANQFVLLDCESHMPFKLFNLAQKVKIGVVESVVDPSLVKHIFFERFNLLFPVVAMASLVFKSLLLSLMGSL